MMTTSAQTFNLNRSYTVFRKGSQRQAQFVKVREQRQTTTGTDKGGMER